MVEIEKGRDAMVKSLYDYCIERDEFKLLVQWDKEKNEPLSTRDISYRTGQGSGCPYCARLMRAPGDSSLATKCPVLVRKRWSIPELCPVCAGKVKENRQMIRAGPG